LNFSELVDANENNLLNIDYYLLDILLKDRTTNKNIIWATDTYEPHGKNYSASSHILIEQIIGKHGQVIRPRIRKSQSEQFKRINDKGEVFTPSWICNKQNNLADESWFQKRNVFNITKGNEWITNPAKIDFPKDKNWIEYIKSIRLEVSCGEAPYIVSRYDTTTGKIIGTNNRIGLLDRKIRIVNENTTTKEEWKKYVIESYKSVFGYEWQGDSLLIARENLLYTYIDYYLERFKEKPYIEDLKEIAEIISWNFFQMDGIKFVIPNSCKNELEIDHTLFGEQRIKNECLGCKKNNIFLHNGTYVKIMNWETHKPIKFISLLKNKK